MHNRSAAVGKAPYAGRLNRQGRAADNTEPTVIHTFTNTTDPPLYTIFTESDADPPPAVHMPTPTCITTARISLLFYR